MYEVKCYYKRRKTRTSYEEVTIMDLPTVIMLEIISRLPIKSIFCCKCVCKPWYTLSYDPLFAKMYHTRSPPFPYLLLSVDDSVTSILELNAHYDYSSEPQNTYNCGNDFVKPKLKLIGPCNGFICLLNGKTSDSKHLVYISNPLLREYIKLKLPKWVRGVRLVAYRFCYNEASGQYKVLRSVFKRRTNGGPKVFELEVYTPGVDEKWRNVGEAPRPPMQESFGSVNINGSLHWLDGKEFARIDRINSFAIGTEKVKSLPPPPGVSTKSFCLNLTELRNCLCLTHIVFMHFHVDIWWMKEYGISESWTKCYHIKLTGFLGYVYKPIIIWKDGEILMQRGCAASLVSYDPKEKKFMEVSVYGGGQAAVSYVPSFYSLKTVMGTAFKSQIFVRRTR